MGNDELGLSVGICVGIALGFIVVGKLVLGLKVLGARVLGLIVVDATVGNEVVGLGEGGCEGRGVGRPNVVVRLHATSTIRINLKHCIILCIALTRQNTV